MSEINWELLQKMRDFLANKVKPEQFDMSQFLPGLFDSSVETIQAYSKMPCGSAGCVLGHTALNPDLNPDRVNIEYFCDHKLGIEYDCSLWDYLFSGKWSEREGENGPHDLPEDVQLKEAIYRLDQVLQYKGTKLKNFNKPCWAAYETGELDLQVTVHPIPAGTGARA